ncbi:MAG TPA: DUF3788 family protein [Gemmatimonadaceae bacterium]
MALSVFTDRSKPPSDHDVAAALGRTATLWVKVQQQIAVRLPGDVATVWGYTSKSTGWGLRVKQGDRIIVYLTPCEGYFLASFALGQKAVDAARAERLPKALLAVIDAAPKYAEGRGVRLRVRASADAQNVVRLAAIKAAS